MTETTETETPFRDGYTLSTEAVDNGKGYWNYLDVSVWTDGDKVATYRRKYSAMYRTFEPFRQGDRKLALISEDYQKTSVLDLASGEIIATEPPPEQREVNGKLYNVPGFCPVDFWVPDPADENVWFEGDRRPLGTFGFVAGCVWGDDTSWKVQYLDLTKLGEGLVIREERFGYVAYGGRTLRESCSYSGESDRLVMAVDLHFDMETGAVSKYDMEGLKQEKVDG